MMTIVGCDVTLADAKGHLIKGSDSQSYIFETSAECPLAWQFLASGPHFYPEKGKPCATSMVLCHSAVRGLPMIDPNQGASQETLDRLREESYERTRLQILQAVEQQLADYGMTWDDLAEKLKWGDMSGQEVKAFTGDGLDVGIQGLNEIAAVFSAEVYVIFRPRFPWVPRR
jgi:hypothetical protein